jgi:hypothetical protein
MGKVYRDGKAAVKRNRAIAGKLTTPDPFSPPRDLVIIVAERGNEGTKSPYAITTIRRARQGKIGQVVGRVRLAE